jgi:hypothetical protein
MKKRSSIVAPLLALSVSLIVACLLAMTPIQSTAFANDGGSGPCPGELLPCDTTCDSLVEGPKRVPQSSTEGGNLASVFVLLIQAIF